MAAQKSPPAGGLFCLRGAASGFGLQPEKMDNGKKTSFRPPNPASLHPHKHQITEDCPKNQKTPAGPEGASGC
jgi:hypothetical protein